MDEAFLALDFLGAVDEALALDFLGAVDEALTLDFGGAVDEAEDLVLDFLEVGAKTPANTELSGIKYPANN